MSEKKPDIVRCPYSARCGGCGYMGANYEDTLKKKQDEVVKLLKGFGHVNTIVGADNPYNYRNKVHAVLSGGRRGEIYAGTYEAGTHKVVDVKSCAIDDVRADAIIRSVVELMPSFKYQPYDEDAHRGFLRHILVRTGAKTGQILLCLVVADDVFPSAKNFVKAILKLHPDITTIVMNVNNRNTGMVLGQRERVLYGKGYIEDELCGHRFCISAKSFYQINSAQCEKLYSIAVDYAKLSGNEYVLDAYSGIGTIGITAAAHARSVVGIELNPDAVRDAVRNVKINCITNARFMQGDAGEFMVREAGQKRRYDVVFMDPPRAGSSKDFLKAIAVSAPRKIVYVSCNPQTLARDIKELSKSGYTMKECTPVDMFPWTEGTECVCMLEKTI